MTGGAPRSGTEVRAAPPIDGLDPLFRKEAPRLLRYFRHHLGDSDAASDMMQESFSRLLRMSRLAKLTNPAAYLQRIARNLLIDAGRRAANAPREVLLDEAAEIAVAPDQEDGLAAEALLARYESAVAELSEKTRTVFLMQRVEALSYRQIADRLGISIATVEYHMMRAIAHLDEALERP